MELTNTYEGIEKNNFIIEGYKAIAVGRESIEKIDQSKKNTILPVVEEISEKNLNNSPEVMTKTITSKEQNAASIEMPYQAQNDLMNADLNSIKPITNVAKVEESSPINMEPEEQVVAMDIPVFDAVTPIITEPNEGIDSSLVDTGNKSLETQQNLFDLTGTIEPTIGEPVALEPVEVNEAIFDMPDREIQQDGLNHLANDSQPIDASLIYEIPKEEQSVRSQIQQEKISQLQTTDAPKIQSVPIINPNESIDLEGKLKGILDSTINLQRELEQVSEILKNDRLQREGVLASAQQELNSIVAQQVQTVENQTMAL